jgi:hypothetical protein
MPFSTRTIRGENAKNRAFYGMKKFTAAAVNPLGINQGEAW